MPSRARPIGFARGEQRSGPPRMMHLVRLINELSPWVVALLIVAAAEIYSIGLMLLCRRRWGTSMLSLNNEVAGFKFAVVGVLYAVLLAFVVVAVWQNYSNTESAVRNEAKAIVDLDQLADELPETDIFIPTPRRSAKASGPAWRVARRARPWLATSIICGRRSFKEVRKG